MMRYELWAGGTEKKKMRWRRKSERKNEWGMGARCWDA